MKGATRLIALLFTALLASTAHAQGQTPETPEPRAGDGRIEGRLVHADGVTGAPDAEVVLYALSSGGQAGLRRAKSDALGRFAFDKIATDADVVYLVGARVGGIPFGSRVTFREGETLREIEIEVASTLDDPSRVEAGDLQIRLAQGCTHVRIWHTHTLRNDTDSVIHIPEDAREGREPLASTRLPANAVGFETPIGGQGLALVDGEVRFWGPLYPGSQAMEFGYGVPSEGGIATVDLSSRTGAARLRIVVPPGHATPTAEDLVRTGSLTLEGVPHSAYEAPAIAAGETLALRLPTPPLPESDVEVTHSRLWLEIDDVALSVNEIHRIHSASERDSSGLPLLCLPMPENALEQRFSAEARAMGLAVDPSGVLSFHGPLPAGESGFAFSYQLEASSNPLQFERHFGADVELLEVILADTGVVPKTTRLHPRRPIRSDDRNYLALEAFAVDADEIVSLEITRLTPGGGMTGAMAAGFIALAGIGALAFLLAPLRVEREEEVAVDLETSMERQAIYKAIDDLDEDLSTGKLSAEDHQRMRDELRGQAVELLRQEREVTRSSAPMRASRCPGCQAKIRLGDRFCAQCGEALGPRPDPSNQESAA
jgi:hypothetical protein